jgi:hypothetical protein
MMIAWPELNRYLKETFGLDKYAGKSVHRSPAPDPATQTP